MIEEMNKEEIQNEKLEINVTGLGIDIKKNITTEQARKILNIILEQQRL